MRFGLRLALCLVGLAGAAGLLLLTATSFESAAGEPVVGRSFFYTAGFLGLGISASILSEASGRPAERLVPLPPRRKGTPAPELAMTDECRQADLDATYMGEEEANPLG